jgi:hypothetical protein
MISRTAIVLFTLLSVTAATAEETTYLSVAQFSRDYEAFGKLIEVKPSKTRQESLPLRKVGSTRDFVVTEWLVEVEGKTHRFETELLYETHLRNDKKTHDWKDFSRVALHWGGRATLECLPGLRSCINIDMGSGRVTFSYVIVRNRDKTLPDLLVYGVWDVKPHLAIEKWEEPARTKR